MMTEHFKLEELIKTNTGLQNEPNIEQTTNLKALANTILEPLRVKFDEPIIVNSAFRSEEVNNKVGGSKKSQHLNGQAADITSKDNKRLWDVAIQMVKDGEIEVGQLIDEYNLRWIHISLPTLKINNQIKHIP